MTHHRYIRDVDDMFKAPESQLMFVVDWGIEILTGVDSGWRPKAGTSVMHGWLQ